MTSEERRDVWRRIQRGEATAEDHKLALEWGRSHMAGARKKAPAFMRWFVKHGDEILSNRASSINNDRGLTPATTEELCAAFIYAKSEIENSGFGAYFSSESAQFAPEALECLSRIGFNELAIIFQSAVLAFGEVYPRDQSVRLALMRTLSRELNEASRQYYAVHDSEMSKGIEERLSDLLSDVG